MGGVMGEFAHLDHETAIAIAEEMRSQRDLAHKELDRLRLEMPTLRAASELADAIRMKDERRQAMRNLAAMKLSNAKHTSNARRVAYLARSLPLYH